VRVRWNEVLGAISDFSVVEEINRMIIGTESNLSSFQLPFAISHDGFQSKAALPF